VRVAQRPVRGEGDDLDPSLDAAATGSLTQAREKSWKSKLAGNCFATGWPRAAASAARLLKILAVAGRGL
jgi:hypothetical protein